MSRHLAQQPSWRRLLSMFCTAMFGLTAIAPAAPVFVQDVPDFYQHQLSGYDASRPFGRPTNFAGYANPTIPTFSNIQPLDNGGPGIQWERNGGWCYITSFTSAFYQLDKKGASGLFNQGGDHTWLERMNYAITEFAIHAWGFGEAGPQSAEQFITRKIGAGRITLDRFTWDADIPAFDATTRSLPSPRCMVPTGTKWLLETRSFWI